MKQFQKVQVNKPKRSMFDLSHERKTTISPAAITPIAALEVLPGDTFSVDLECFMRTLPLISPVMHRVNLFAHAFFVPYRLLMEEGEFEKFITGRGVDQLPSWDPSYFSLDKEAFTKCELIDHLRYFDNSTSGIVPDGPFSGKPVSQMNLRAYHKIWNDYYRDQNFQEEYDFKSLPYVMNSTQSATFDPTLFKLRYRNFEKDYFTSALLTQQRGEPVTIPIGDSAPIKGRMQLSYEENSLDPASNISPETDINGELIAGLDPLYVYDNGSSSGLRADLSEATATTVSTLRQAFALMRWYEASMRFGQRYTEMLFGLFGVRSKDSRLQRAEYIRGGKQPVMIGEVLQTSSSDLTSPQGNMSGKAVSVGNMFGFKQSFTEHGVLMVLVSCLPRTSYIGICDRHNLKLEKFDFAFPQFSHLSEQPVYNQELYQTDDVVATQPFGYQPIYSEYRYVPDSVHGDFRNSLAFWGLSRAFDTTPTLSEDFIKGEFPQEIFAVAGGENKMLLQSYMRITAVRPLPKFGTPI